MAADTSPSSSRTDVPLDEEKNKLAGHRSFAHTEGANADASSYKGGELYVPRTDWLDSSTACSS